MRQRDRLLAILAVLLIVATLKVAQQVVRWYAFAEERATIASLEADLEGSALGVIATQIEADSLRRLITGIDSTLEAGRSRLERFEREVARTGIRRSLEVAYRRELDGYNDYVRDRNALFRSWRETVNRNHAYVDRYNLLADSMRRVAESMGDPYYPILSPAEIAERHGLIDSFSSPG